MIVYNHIMCNRIMCNRYMYTCRLCRSTWSSAFYNRDEELRTIETLLSTMRAELVVVYGRRGSGKSALLVRALADRRALYYQATTEVLTQQLTDLNGGHPRCGA